MKKKCLLALMLVLTASCLCSCKENPTGDELFARLIGHFSARGFSCRLERAEDGRDVPIYNASVWYSLKLDGEEVLVYFDESNRADYLSAPIDREKYGFVTRYGLRFVLVYPGSDQRVLDALNAIENI